MADPLINEILALGQSLGRHPARLVLPEEGSLAYRVTDNRVTVTRRGATLAELQASDFVHMDMQRINEVAAHDPVLAEDLASTQLHAEYGAEPHEDVALFSWLLGQDSSLRVATHVHPVVVDQITASPRARQFADRRTVHNEVLALGSASLLVNYSEPGLPLTREIQKKMILWRDRYKSVPRIILVQNHGVLMLGESGPALLRAVDALIKYAELFTWASLLGGPVFLTPQAITQIEQQHRRGA
ncbi:MAG TPA: class II aldolase/adducin family protein [Chthoniobacteraceae bacterium]|jgi:ribulose-5-phosphate 4-epimerase/fuculose-1-phosphate aldolase|nr:class II aldolase/adducin family protein [Chthoniobacteraceae bacterium]